jgi:hypothetical protein
MQQTGRKNTTTRLNQYLSDSFFLSTTILINNIYYASFLPPYARPKPNAQSRCVTISICVFVVCVCVCVSLTAPAPHKISARTASHAKLPTQAPHSQMLAAAEELNHFPRWGASNFSVSFRFLSLLSVF